MCAQASPVVATVSSSPGETVRMAVTSTGSHVPNAVGSVPRGAVTVRSNAPPSGPAVGPSRCSEAAVLSGVASNRLRSTSSVVLAWAEAGRTPADRKTAAQAVIRIERGRMRAPMARPGLRHRRKTGPERCLGLGRVADPPYADTGRLVTRPAIAYSSRDHAFI